MLNIRDFVILSFVVIGWGVVAFARDNEPWKASPPEMRGWFENLIRPEQSPPVHRVAH